VLLLAVPQAMPLCPATSGFAPVRRMPALEQLHCGRAGGYLLEVIAPDDPAVHAAIEGFATAELGATPVEGSQLGRAQFRLAPDGRSLSAVFRAVETVKHRLQVRMSRPDAEASGLC